MLHPVTRSSRGLVIAAGLAALLCGAAAAPALADPDDWNRRGWREHESREQAWREHEWREHEWRERQPYGYGYYDYRYAYPPGYYYAPPPVTYAPPSFGLSFMFR